jgi:hypothetical protein
MTVYCGVSVVKKTAAVAVVHTTLISLVSKEESRESRENVRRTEEDNGKLFDVSKT